MQVPSKDVVDQYGNFYPPAGNGVIDPRTGDFYPRAGNGFVNPKTGEFMPAH